MFKDAHRPKDLLYGISFSAAVIFTVLVTSSSQEIPIEGSRFLELALCVCVFCLLL